MLLLPSGSVRTLQSLAVFAAVASSCFAQAPVYSYKVVNVYPHERSAFTQGLEYRNGFLYEGTGLQGASGLRKVDLKTGRVLQSISIPVQYFGEGITILGPRLFELTWKNEQGFEYDAATFRQVRSFKYFGEGWGLTNDGKSIYMSDGTPQIRVWDGATLLEERRFGVRDAGKQVTYLNELEWVKGEIYANVWQTDRIVRISPADGKVLGWIDLTGILPAADRAADTDVLNGIAYDAAGDRLFVTGKKWPKLFEIKVVPKASTTAPAAKAK